MLMPCFGKKSFWPEARNKAVLVMDLFMPARYWVNQRVLRQVGVVSRKPRNFRQPINMACLALGR